MNVSEELGCDDDYIGRTERELRQHCGECRSAIQNKNLAQGVHEHLSE